MAQGNHAEEFIGKLDARLEDINRQLADVEAPPSMYREHYRALLEMAQATGELSCYDDSWFIDPDTGLLAAQIHLHIPRRPELIIP